ncbi:hypothetical protein HNR46_000671 [Haloferula luteola]|uniref:VIT domain-containing protein n=1 Tax=Haloferula luteola TaxID=595692 RepID=A0A840UWA5_9BACT|nr:VIT domain-containing protein [Haloferula luteola]MBB5350447.1 hypothetical protein [Haloferula luteola]
MKKWTMEAEYRLQEYLQARVLREGLDREDAEELKDDLRAHLLEEAERLPGERVDSGVLEEALTRLEAGSEMESEVMVATSRWRKVAVWMFGVLLPAGVGIFEAFSGFCAEVFFNPVVDIWHLLLVLAIPVLNAWLLTKGRWMGSRWQGLAAGWAIAISGFYALLFLPLLPASLIAVLFLGLGFLSLSPILAWWVCLRISRSRKSRVPRPWEYRSGWRWGLAAGIFSLVLLDGPGIWTRLQLEEATQTGKSAESAISRLRFFHSEETLLQACYEGNRGTNRRTDISGWVSTGVLRSPDSEKVREVFFRVTGTPFNALEPPRGSLKVRERGERVEWQFDDHLGGDDVAVRLKGLELGESRIDAHLDGVSRIGYGEWTMVFENATLRPQEARCQVRLPRGGRVSRLTLWVNGEPREAAFSTVKKVKEAYREIAVRQQRDPVLVTMVGPDTVMVQCFPVPPGGSMKIRFGVTAPLDGGEWEMPRLVERNFSFEENLRHAVWVQANQDFSVPGLGEGEPDGDGYACQIMTPADRLTGNGSVVRLSELDDEPSRVWCRDPMAKVEESVLSRSPHRLHEVGYDRVVVVVDGSVSMAEAADWLDEVTASSSAEFLLATDQVEPYRKDYRFRGGRDNEPALREAIVRARGNERGAVVWLHGPQPVKLAESEALLQLLQRGTHRPEIFEIEVAPGPNRLAEALGREGALKRGPRLANPLRDLEAFLAELRAGRDRLEWDWSRTSPEQPVLGEEVWDQLARLWAIEQADGRGEEVGEVAAQYQIVSPVSGAVVLETDEQYRRHGLDPAEISAVPHLPAVPEPSAFLLVLLGASSMVFRRRRLSA